MGMLDRLRSAFTISAPPQAAANLPAVVEPDPPADESKAAWDVQDFEFRPVDSLIEHALFGSTTVTAGQAFRHYQTSSAVATAIERIAPLVEQIRPVVRRNGSLVESHPVTDFLASPNDHCLWRRLIGDAARHYLLTSNVYLFAAGTVTRDPVALYTVHPTMAGPFASTGNYPESYTVSDMTARGIYVAERGKRKLGLRFYDGPLRELYHIRGFSSRPMNMIGDSPLEAILLEIYQQVAGRRHNASLLEKGGRLSMSVIFKDKMSNEQYAHRIKMIQEKYGGASNAGAIAVYAGSDVDIKEHGMHNKDMDYVELDKLASMAVWNRYKIPLPLVTSDRQTLNNYEVAVLALYDDAVIPCYEVLAEALTDMLMPRFGLDPMREKISYDPASITALRLRTLTELERRGKLGIETINEQREGLPGRGPIEGGNAVFGTTAPIAGDDMPEIVPVDPDLDAGAQAPNAQAEDQESEDEQEAA